jgi:hypothetical protein
VRSTFGSTSAIIEYSERLVTSNMQEMTGNLWDFYSLGEQHVACITTNGFVKRNGECVMGRGCAREARDRFPGLAKLLGDTIKRLGNKVYVFGTLRIISFPTKHVWWEKSDLPLIEKSAQELANFARATPNNIFYLPRPGCGNGRLKWSDVKPAIEGILPDNVVIVDYKQKGAK